MTDNMVERVARALAVADGKNPDADWRITELPTGNTIMADVIDDEPEIWRRYINKARAAIAAMREPTEAMLDAAALADDPLNLDGVTTLMESVHRRIRCEWQAMIETATA